MAAAQQIWLDARRGVDVGPDLVRGLKHPSVRARSLCISSLVRLNIRAHADDVAALLADPDERVRIHAARALRQLGSWQDPTPLLRGLVDRSQAERLRVDLAWALGERREPSAEEPLARIAADPAEAMLLRQEALQALGRLASEGRIPYLAQILESRERPLELRVAAAKALGQLAAPPARAALRKAASRQREAEVVRAEAASSLGSHGGAEDIPVLKGLAETPDQSLQVRLAAASALTRLQVAPEGVNRLIRQGLRHPSPRIRAEAACLARETGDPEVGEDLRRALAGESSRKVRGELRAALRRLQTDARMDPDSGLAP